MRDVLHRAGDRSIGLDGVTYHFANWRLHLGYIAGQTWSPPATSPAAKSIAVGQKLRDLVRAAPEKCAAVKDELMRA